MSTIEGYAYNVGFGFSIPQNPYPDPYYQTMSYDVWGNITNRAGSLYTGDVALSDSGSYTNNRRAGWTYDADGNALSDQRYQHGFNAAGRNQSASSFVNVGDGTAQFPTQPNLEITQSYDGDGTSRKRVQVPRQNVYEDFNPEHPLVQVLEDTQTSYYLKSSVLGGARVVEMNVLGAKRSVWIYAGGQRIAKEENGSVTFEHHNPATGSWLRTNGHSSIAVRPEKSAIPQTQRYLYRILIL